MSDDAVDVVVVGSVAELERLSGISPITDLHKEHVDLITIPSPRGPSFPRLHRVDDVLDCWFESGSMPYAQVHYPFENKELFEAGFPADFIAEGLDQTRGWFYSLLVISTALFNISPFKNVVVNGLVLAADGKKMSKRLKNYEEPTVVIDEFGADALRLYLIDSPVVRAEPLCFKKEYVSVHHHRRHLVVCFCLFCGFLLWFVCLPLIHLPLSLLSLPFSCLFLFPSLVPTR